MHFAESYFTRYNKLIPQIMEPPAGLLFFIMVIPAYLEEDIISTLESVKNASLPEGYCEIVIVFNFSESDSESNKTICMDQYHLTHEWCAANSMAERKFFPLLAADLPAKYAGAGLARKIGMDEALYRFGMLNKSEGIILSLDADTLVGKNYFRAIEKVMNSRPEAGGCLLPFCHRIQGNEFKPEVYRAIIQYELHLRYYKHMLEYTGFPHAHYTIGSCFGVRASVYARNGGMNRRKAGEDFYFLNKLFPHTRFADITDTIVFPSSRPSSRVLFGTGPVINQLVQNPETELLTYHPQAFFDLRNLFDTVPNFYTLDPVLFKDRLHNFSPALQGFLMEVDFHRKVVEIADNTSTLSAFVKRFYLWFDGFRVVKYLNYIHSEYHKKIPVKQAVCNYFDTILQDYTTGNDTELLLIFRKLDGIHSDP
jgi:hypothetical protein